MGATLTIEVFWDKEPVYRQSTGVIRKGRRRLPTIVLQPLRTAAARLSDRDVLAIVRSKGFSYPRSNIVGDWPFWQDYREVPAGDTDAVVVDPNTGLMWQQRGSEGIPWRADEQPDARAYMAGLNRARHAGFGDWRVPSVEELLSLMQSRSGTTHIDQVFDRDLDEIWSVDTRPDGTPLRVAFDVGEVNTGRAAAVRAVRSVKLADDLGGR